jgi:RNA recognition motif-containing protein
MRLYVGNLSFDSTEASIHQAFAAFGGVNSVQIVTDRETGRPRGFGFVDMAESQEGEAAISGLNGAELDGRALTVNEAHARPTGERSFRGDRKRNSDW